MSESQIVNQVYYKEVLTNLCEWVRRRRPEMWKSGSWVLHQNNALSVKAFLTKHKIKVLEHPPYSPDLTPCDFLPHFRSSSSHPFTKVCQNLLAVNLVNGLTFRHPIHVNNPSNVGGKPDNHCFKVGFALPCFLLP